MTMKRIFIIITTVFSLLVLSTQTADAQFSIRGLLRASGASDDNFWTEMAGVVDCIGNAISAKSVDSVIGTYGKDAANNYDNFVNDYNSRKERELKAYLSEVDQFKMEYCKSHGFYDSWVESMERNGLIEEEESGLIVRMRLIFVELVGTICFLGI